MCGLYGYRTLEPDNTENKIMFKILGFANEQRGKDSTGIVLKNGNKTTIVKDTKPAEAFFMGRRFKDYFIGMGHTRLATHGKVTKENAHPFKYGSVIGCHNGVVYNYEEIGKFNVDSMAIFYLLNQYQNDYVQAFKRLRGTMSVSWIHRNVLHLMRHNNPLYILNSEKTLFYSSLEKPLELIKSSFNLDGEISSLEQDIVFMINNKLKIKTKPVEFKALPAYNSSPRYSTDLTEKWEDTKKRVNQAEKNKVSWQERMKRKWKKDQKPTLDEPETDVEIIEKANKLAFQQNCSYCGQYLDEYEFMADLREDRVFHKSCYIRGKTNIPGIKLIDLDEAFLSYDSNYDYPEYPSAIY